MSKLFQYLGTKTFRRHLIIAIISIIVLVSLIFFVLRSYTHHGEKIKVPDLKNKSITEAIDLLEREGFRYQVDSVYQTDAKPGIILDQDPVAGSFVKDNRTIYLTMITLSPPIVSFPEIREMTFLEARAVLGNYELRLGDTIYVPDIARDVVLDVRYGGEELKAGQEIPKGSRINLILGNGMGDSEVLVPNVVGLTLNEARFSILGSSLTVGEVNYMGYITDSLTARVVSQTPPADSLQMEKVSVGTAINLALSN